ncbi:hypothetical protein CKALI_10525 [Corynebacterium kalinowskii]|nr:hypothetical protein CKALI_10525 [Corynebacterium kalinowskii]
MSASRFGVLISILWNRAFRRAKCTRSSAILVLAELHAGRFCTYNFYKSEVNPMGSVIKKRRKRMSKKKHRKMLRRTRVQRRKLGK